MSFFNPKTVQFNSDNDEPISKEIKQKEIEALRKEVKRVARKIIKKINQEVAQPVQPSMSIKMHRTCVINVTEDSYFGSLAHRLIHNWRFPNLGLKKFHIESVEKETHILPLILKAFEKEGIIYSHKQGRWEGLERVAMA